CVAKAIITLHTITYNTLCWSLNDHNVGLFLSPHLPLSLSFSRFLSLSLSLPTPPSLSISLVFSVSLSLSLSLSLTLHISLWLDQALQGGYVSPLSPLTPLLPPRGLLQT